MQSGGNAMPLFTTLLAWLSALWHWILQILGWNNRAPPGMPPATPLAEAVAAPRARSANLGDVLRRRKDGEEKNEYWGGDSTVFQGKGKIEDDEEKEE